MAFLEQVTFHAYFGYQQSQLYTNRNDDFMTSSIKTSAKDTLRPIFGDISLVPSCMKM